MFIARTITLVAGTLAATASAAGAASTGGTRIDYRDGFTTQTPGAAAGRVFRDEFFNASDPNAKPRRSRTSASTSPPARDSIRAPSRAAARPMHS